MFVLKLDEAEVVNGKKFERVSLTLMNRALDPAIQLDDERYFSVQSEQEIWPIGCFQVGKESYDILDWAFQQTKWPEVIAAQSRGQQLIVNGVGNFNIEWHLSADMKTIKCMNGLQHGPTSCMTCIYYEQLREKSKPCSAHVAEHEAVIRGKGNWQGGLFAPRISGEPCDAVTHPRWKQVLPIPLSRTHMCTLHAQVRIIEKILHMHFMHVWNMQDSQRRALAINAMEKSLSAIGVEGGNCRLRKDEKKSGKTGNVVMKPSLSGGVAARLFRPSPWSTNDKVWKDVVMSEHNNLDRGNARLRRFRVWETLEAVQPYLTGLVLKQDERANYRSKMDSFGKAFLEAFGETHVTPYIVRFHPSKSNRLV
jgi:hypothetical protein